MAKQLDIDGMHFNSLEEVAEYVGVSIGAISQRIQRYGEHSEEVLKAPQYHRHAPKEGYNIDGHHFDTIKEMAKFVGISVGGMQTRIRKYGVSNPKLLEKRKKTSGPRSTPRYTIDGQPISNLSRWCKDNGIGYYLIKDFVKQRGTAFKGNDLIDYARQSKRQRKMTIGDGRSKMIVIAGHRFSSITEAANYAGVSQPAMSTRIKKYGTNNPIILQKHMANHPVDDASHEPKHKQKADAVAHYVIDGIPIKSLSAWCENNGVSYNKVMPFIAHGHINTTSREIFDYVKGRAKKPKPKIMACATRHTETRIVVFDRLFSSIETASDYYHVNLTTYIKAYGRSWQKWPVSLRNKLRVINAEKRKAGVK